MKSAQAPSICVTNQDKARLKILIDANERERVQRDDLSALAYELDRATVVEPEVIPRNTVTMNSRVSVVDLDTSERFAFTLVFPKDADQDAKKISVLAPLGSGMLGYRTGDEFEWNVPAGKRRLKIARVSYQPEAKKHFHL